jgi:predicted peroxiredoxin
MGTALLHGPSADDVEMSTEDVLHFHLVATFGFDQAVVGARQFSGDMTAWYIYRAFLVACAADLLRTLHGAAFVTSRCSSRLSAQSISEMTGIPRQTVRRKCQELHDRGVLSVCESSLFQLTLSGDEIRDLITPVAQMARRLTGAGATNKPRHAVPGLSEQASPH